MISNEIIVVPPEDPLLFAHQLRVSRPAFSWVSGEEPSVFADSGEEPSVLTGASSSSSSSLKPLRAFCRLRHNGALHACAVHFQSKMLSVVLDEPERGVTEGQVLALHSFEDPQVCLGGGAIKSVRRQGVWSERP